MMHIAIRPIFALLLLIPVVAKSQPAPVLAGDKEMLNLPFAKFESVQGNGTFSKQFKLPIDHEIFRLYFDQIITDGSTPFKIQLLGRDGKIGEITETDFTRDTTYLSDLFIGLDVTLEIVADQEVQNLSFRLVEVAYETPSGEPLSVTGPDQRQKVRNLTRGDAKQNSSRAVAKLTFRAENTKYYNCTGFLIAADKLLTNEHCINSAVRCATARAIFGYLSASAETEQARCKKILVKDTSGDLALVQLDRRVGKNWGTLTLATTMPAVGAALYIPQHPDGRPQEVSIDNCKMVEVLVPGVSGKTDFSHSCDTEPGASGSPVIDTRSNEVIGLHHWGFEKSSSLFQNLNRAVRIDEVRKIVDKH